jgi:serine/threonine-protein kinase
LKGKLPYMAPEQLSSGPIDRRVDIYAAGCVLWEMLTLQRLFQGDDEAQLLAGVLQGARHPPSALRRDVPPSIDAVCLQALGKLEYRFPTATAFAEAIEEAARAGGIRVASLREVGRFVKELAPVPQEPSAGVDGGSGSAPPGRGLGVSTPQRWQGTPAAGAPQGSVPQLAATIALPASSYPSVPPSTGSGVMPALPAFATPARLPEAVPTTNSSVIAMPINPGIGRHKIMVTMVGALGVAVLGVGIAYLATGDAPSPDPGLSVPTLPDATTTTSPEPEPSVAPTADPSVEPTSTASSDTPAATTTRRPVGTGRPKPETKSTASAKVPPPPPPPPPTGTEFRPALP